MSAGVVVHVVPRARRTEIVGRHGDAIKIRLRALPVAGAANAELIRFIAARLGVPERAVTIAHGARGRRKILRVDGVGPGALESALCDSAAAQDARAALNTRNR